ncbi:MAG: TIGR01906 family membrane protein [Anaerolineae bacterium]
MTTAPISTEPAPASDFTLPAWLTMPMQVFIIAALPLVLILINARLLMTDAFLRWQYTRPGFPPDPYGMTQAQRLEYAPPALAYLFNDEDISFLGDMTFPDGSPMYNERELRHMADVKVVTRQLSTAGYILIGVLAVCIVALAAGRSSRLPLYRSLFAAGVLTILLIAAGLIAVATSFNWLFTQFHALFFEGDSWIFLYSDTLIRLFPIQFWTMAFVLIFGGALLEAGILSGVMWRLMRR